MKGETYHMKNIYTEPEMEIISFEAEDVITVSPSIIPDDDETKLL